MLGAEATVGHRAAPALTGHQVENRTHSWWKFGPPGDTCGDQLDWSRAFVKGEVGTRLHLR